MASRDTFKQFGKVHAKGTSVHLFHGWLSPLCPFLDLWTQTEPHRVLHLLLKGAEKAALIYRVQFKLDETCESSFSINLQGQCNESVLQTLSCPSLRIQAADRCRLVARGPCGESCASSTKLLQGDEGQGKVCEGTEHRRAEGLLLCQWHTVTTEPVRIGAGSSVSRWPRD